MAPGPESSQRGWSREKPTAEETREIIRRPRLYATETMLRYPSGARHPYVVRHHGGDVVSVVARTERRTFLMVRQYRFPLDNWTLELPAGSVERGEAPDAAARRELMEETGHSAAEWLGMGGVYASPAGSSLRHHFYLALGCRRTGEVRVDEREVVETAEWTEADVRTALASGRVPAVADAGQRSGDGSSAAHRNAPWGACDPQLSLQVLAGLGMACARLGI